MFEISNLEPVVKYSSYEFSVPNIGFSICSCYVLIVQTLSNSVSAFLFYDKQVWTIRSCVHLDCGDCRLLFDRGSRHQRNEFVFASSMHPKCFATEISSHAAASDYGKATIRARFLRQKAVQRGAANGKMH